MVPLASSGPAVMGTAIVAALIAIWLLLRMDKRDEDARKAREEGSGKVDPYA